MKHPNDWHLLEKEEVLYALAVDMYKGLTDAEVRRRRRSAGSNDIWRVPRVSAWDAAIAAIFDLAALLLIISAAAAAFFDKSTEAGALVLILIIGAVLRTVTYVRANRILEDRAREKIPTASVIRDGRVRLVSASEIVPGDIILLEQGDTVPCDGRVVAGEDAMISERGITENKTPVHKFDTTIETASASGEIPCEFRSNMLFAGSLVLSGSLRMAATACGEAALITRKQGGIELPRADKLPIIEKLRIRSKTTSLVMLAFVMLLTALSLFMGEGTSLPDVFLGTMSMAVAAMSEFLTIIGTIMVAVSIRDAAEINAHQAERTQNGTTRAVIRQPEKLEEICGIKRIVFCGSSFFKSGRSELYAYRAAGEYSLFGRSAANDPLKELLALAAAASAETQTGMAAGGMSEVKRESDIRAIVERAIDSFVEKSGEMLTVSHALYDHKGSAEPYTMGMEISLIDRDNDVWAAAAGPIGSVLRCCTSVETKDGVVPLTDEIKRRIYTECARLEFGGAQIAAVAVRKSPYLQLNRVSVLTQYMTFVGFIAVSEEPEENAAHDLSYLKENGVVPILFSEKPEADLYYCHRIGLFNKNTVRVRAAELNEDIVDSVGADGMIVSFADVSSVHLASAYSAAMKLVMHNRATGADKILQDEEDAAPITAAIGRETWDSGVLASADVGIAAARSKMRTVPETLSRNAAVLVNKESQKTAEAGFGGLNGIIRAMRASARVSINIESAKSYLTAAQSARLVVILAAILFDVPLISAVFILIWGLLFDFAAVLMMAFETHEDCAAAIPSAERREAVVSVVIGVLWGVLLAVFIPLVRLAAEPLGFVVSANEELALLSAAIILSGVVLAFVRMKFSHGRNRLRIHMAGLLFIAASVVLAVVLTVTDSAVIGAAVCGWNAVLALVPALVCLGVSEICRAVVYGKKKQ